jgi:hypothetical protein
MMPSKTLNNERPSAHKRAFTLFLPKSLFLIFFATTIGDEQLNPDHCQIKCHIRMLASGQLKVEAHALVFSLI